MELVAITVLVVFLLTHIFEFLSKLTANNVSSPIYDAINNPTQYIEIINTFIRREVNIEILKWLMEGRIEKSASTFDTTFVMQITNSEEIKKKTSVITSIVASKISPDIHRIFNRVYKKNLVKADKKISVDISLQEYVARYVFFMFRKLVYDITKMINDIEYNDKNIESIINIYIVTLEENIYKDNNIAIIS